MDGAKSFTNRFEKGVPPSGMKGEAKNLTSGKQSSTFQNQEPPNAKATLKPMTGLKPITGVLSARNKPMQGKDITARCQAGMRNLNKKAT